eukprot:GHUV01055347.1.p1 GENE.GHUV01055347.1~~GHUV01055347.1.p1  ORF type:complete len:103 (+),score=5.69 GHUV01055347.1:189-497(+)
MAWLMPYIVIKITLALVSRLNRNRAVFTPPIASGTAKLPACKPLLGDAVEALANLARFHDWLLESSIKLGVTWAQSVPTRPAYCVVSGLHGTCWKAKDERPL